MQMSIKAQITSYGFLKCQCTPVLSGVAAGWYKREREALAMIRSELCWANFQTIKYIVG